MKTTGYVQNGVVVLDSSVSLPEGTTVFVSYGNDPKTSFAQKQRRVKFPLVASERPGSICLTNEIIADELDQEDASS